jgi:hypothetical protein
MDTSWSVFEMKYSGSVMILNAVEGLKNPSSPSKTDQKSPLAEEGFLLNSFKKIVLTSSSR